jgi:predicted DNA-binding WGR domain protein
MRLFPVMERRQVFRASAKFAARAREYQEVMAEWERRRRAGETMTIFRSEADQLRARLKMTDELWSQIQTLYEQSGNSGKKTRARKHDDRLFGRGVALLERLSDLQRANIRQFRTFLTRPAPKSKGMK